MILAIPFPDISPVILSVDVGAFEIALRWYGLSYSAGLYLGYFLAMRLLLRTNIWRENRPPMGHAQLNSLLVWIAIGVIAGGRLGSVLFYHPVAYLHDPIEILAIWKGGMSFHGGLIGAIMAIAIFCQTRHLPVMPTFDLVALVATPGLFLGRVANFINGELWGRPTDGPWGVAFPGHAAQSCGQPLGEICLRHPSQLYEAALEGALLGAFLLFLALRRGALLHPGRVTGLFAGGYGLARFAVEFVRQPDLHFVSADNPVGLAWHIGGYGLSMGQFLSLPMIALGAWLLARSERANSRSPVRDCDAVTT